MVMFIVYTVNYFNESCIKIKSLWLCANFTWTNGTTSYWYWFFCFPVSQCFIHSRTSLHIKWRKKTYTVFFNYINFFAINVWDWLRKRVRKRNSPNIYLMFRWLVTLHFKEWLFSISGEEFLHSVEEWNCWHSTNLQYSSGKILR